MLWYTVPEDVVSEDAYEERNYHE